MATPRTKRNRRPVTVVAGGQPPLVMWCVATFDGDQGTFIFSLPVIASGIPNIVCVGQGEIASFELVDAQHANFVVNNNTPTSTWFAADAWDPVIRTNNGGFLAPGWFRLGALPQWAVNVPPVGQAPALARTGPPALLDTVATSPADAATAPPEPPFSEKQEETAESFESAAKPKVSKFTRADRPAARRAACRRANPAALG